MLIHAHKNVIDTTKMSSILIGFRPRRHLFYTGSHFSDLQSCTLIFSTHFILFSYLDSARQNLVIELCHALIFPRLFIKLAHSFVSG